MQWAHTQCIKYEHSSCSFRQSGPIQRCVSTVEANVQSWRICETQCFWKNILNCVLTNIHCLMYILFKLEPFILVLVDVFLQMDCTYSIILRAIVCRISAYIGLEDRMYLFQYLLAPSEYLMKHYCSLRCSFHICTHIVLFLLFHLYS